MEAKEIRVIYAPKARMSITHIAAYIEEKGHPETAIGFANKLYNFGDSLGILPDKYSLCKQSQLAKRKMRCAVFHKNYIFIYKQIKQTLIIFNVIHAKSRPNSYAV
jgi:plasmid stabilization system protein ParE